MVVVHPITARDELAITRAMLYGCTFVYNDFGHPERAPARQYWRCVGGGPVIGYGSTQAAAALNWLRRTGREGDLNVNK